ncbi:MAG TPA: F0F1 ATP synthase subunit delta [Casimicrobiaceae bacterium]|nr:F0F1 ATP synthase subunit delta [Casimicrobiaceae bacterium]
MAEPITVARPYAVAVFGLARETNSLPVWSEMLRVASAVAEDERIRSALDNPRLAPGDKESLFLSICGDRLNAEGRSFVRVLIAAERARLLGEIRALFEVMKDEADDVARAKITSAFPVDEGQLAGLKVALQRRFEKKIEASVVVDPALIGGARIVVGDTVIDGSVAGELQTMASHLRT